MKKNIKSVILAMLLSILLPTSAFADITLPVSSNGGLRVGTESDPFWFEISGALKVDQRTYMGDTEKTSSATTNAGTYNSGMFVRDLGITLDGGVGENYTYTIALNFDPTNGGGASRIDDAFMTYHGFKWLMPNFTFSIGQVVPGFCVSCATSSKWTPFLERSMGTNTFAPRQGLGISANSYANNYSVTVAATQQPRSGVAVRNPNGAPILKPDLWQGAIRATFAPIAQVGKVFQVGLSGHIQEHSNTGLQFSTNPEMRSGSSVSLLNTTTQLVQNSINPSVMISALNQQTIDAEMLGIYGPWSGELEYQQVWVTRGNTLAGVKQGPNLTFNGYHAQASYVLTGESRPHKKSNGTTGQIKPKSKCGAWEVSGRYSFITLNDKDVNGGMAHNTSASLSWYANNNIRVIGEYVYSQQSRAFATYFDKRHVSSFGARLQVVF